jgi:exodeoxyribonuclease X
MAVHHITESDFTADTPVCSEDRLRLAVFGGSTPDVLVAHNCSFERMFIPDTATNGMPWICTLKVALRVWPNAPGHSNQILRYWRGLNLDAALAMPPHRAGPDAWVTAHLLAELLKEASVEQMIAWTAEPKLLPKVPFGKHRNLSWSDVPADYLEWMVGKGDMDPDVIWSAQQELVRRTTGAAQER